MPEPRSGRIVDRARSTRKHRLSGSQHNADEEADRHYVHWLNAHLFVRQVALNSVRVFLPMMPPATVSGMVMSAQMRRMITMVPNGRAAVDCAAHK